MEPLSQVDNFEIEENSVSPNAPDVDHKATELLLKKRVKIIKTLALYFSFLAFGMFAAITGPTLIDLENIIGIDTSTITLLYLGRSIAALVGSLVGGILFDMTKKKQLLLMICALFMTLSAFATPWSRNKETLVSMWVIGGLAMGALDTGSNVLCLSIWGKDSAPYFQAMHFVFGLGSFLAPLVSEPFLAKPCLLLPNLHFNVTNDSAVSNLTHSLDQVNNLPCDQYAIPPITYAYSIIGMLSGLVTLYFLILVFLYPIEPKVAKSKCNNQSRTPNFNLLYTIVIAFVAQILLSLYCGIEIGYGQMLTIFAVKGDLKLSKSKASFITAFYWGTFTFARGLSVFLSARFAAFTLVFGDLMAVLTGSIILLIFGDTYVEALWAGTFVLAIGLASFYPSVISWVEMYINVNNKIASMFVIAGTVGDMVVPLVVGQYIESQPQMLLYIVVACIVGGCFMTFILWLIMSKKGPKA